MKLRKLKFYSVFSDWNRLCAVIATGLCIGSLQCKSADLEEPTPREIGLLTEVAGLERSKNADTLLLRNGETLVGKVLTESFFLHAFYGELHLNRSGIAGIDFESGRYQLGRIIAINGDRFSGFISTPAIRFQDQTGLEFEVRRERVLKAAFRIREQELEELPQGRILLWKNGDIASGTPIGIVSMVSTNGNQHSIFPSNAEVITFRGGDRTAASIRKQNGTDIEGLLEKEDVAIQLDVGPRISIYAGHLEAVYDRAVFMARAGNTKSRGNQGSAATIETGPSSAPDRMVWIPPGEAFIGSSSEERDRGLDEGPQAKAVIARGFWMGKFEVTQREFMAVMGVNPSHYTGDLNHPVDKVSWQEAMEYCSKRTAREEEAGTLPEGFFYRLPTEVEWEYACRAGSITRFSFGDDRDYARLGAYAWFNVNSGSETHPVGLKKANPWGLHDMHGNVWEWCLDHWNGSGSEETSSSDSRGSLRGARGGSWLYEGRFCRSANRDAYFPTNRCSDLGFRIVLAPIER